MRLAQWRVKWLIEHSISHQLLWYIDSFVVNQILVFQIKFFGKNPALRVAANRQAVRKLKFNSHFIHSSLYNFRGMY